jgi:hypothetical protein
MWSTPHWECTNVRTKQCFRAGSVSFWASRIPPSARKIFKKKSFYSFSDLSKKLRFVSILKAIEKKSRIWTRMRNPVVWVGDPDPYP